MSPFANTKDLKKRDLSPGSKTHNSSSSKKPCASNNNAWQRWNRDGNAAAMAYINGPPQRVLQGKSDVELDALLAKVILAASNFRDLFPSDHEPEVAMRHRNEERHPEFRDLQIELLIPNIEHGRKFALSFYYGKILAVIHSVVQKSLHTLSIGGNTAMKYLPGGKRIAKMCRWPKIQENIVKLIKWLLRMLDYQMQSNPRG